MELYEFNQMGYHSLPKMSKSRVEANKEEFKKWLDGNFGIGSKYFLLLNNESHYYTFFVRLFESVNILTDELFKLVQELGTLKSIEPSSTDDAYEFWVTGHDGVTRMYLFFNYDRGVIEIEHPRYTTN